MPSFLERNFKELKERITATYKEIGIEVTEIKKTTAGIQVLATTDKGKAPQIFTYLDKDNPNSDSFFNNLNTEAGLLWMHNNHQIGKDMLISPDMVPGKYYSWPDNTLNGHKGLDKFWDPEDCKFDFAEFNKWRVEQLNINAHPNKKAVTFAFAAENQKARVKFRYKEDPPSVEQSVAESKLRELFPTELKRCFREVEKYQKAIAASPNDEMSKKLNYYKNEFKNCESLGRLYGLRNELRETSRIKIGQFDSIMHKVISNLQGKGPSAEKKIKAIKNAMSKASIEDKINLMSKNPTYPGAKAILNALSEHRNIIHWGDTRSVKTYKEELAKIHAPKPSEQKTEASNKTKSEGPRSSNSP